MTKVFLSYSHADEAQAKRLYNELCGHGLDVWFDKESLLPGQSWEDVIEEQIQQTDYVILLLSKRSLIKRGFFHKEIRLALDVLDTIPIGHVYILPLRLDDCEVPARLLGIQYLDLFPHWGNSLTKLYEAIQHQDKVRSRAADAETQQQEGNAVRLLLVNDQPSSMNFVVDLWKGYGIAIEYAFDVPQAIRAIEQSPFDVIVSDLTHFSPAGQVTDRAAFEILEWARDEGRQIKVVISTSSITSERQRLTVELGAVGICNTLQELNRLIGQATGLDIKYSPLRDEEEAPRNIPSGRQNGASGKGAQGVETVFRYEVYMSFSRKDFEFVRRLAGDLEQHGATARLDTISDITTGQAWATPTYEMIRKADFMLVIISSNSIQSQMVEQEIYDGIAKERNTNKRFVIPLLIEPVEKIPFFLSRYQYVDFQHDYGNALNELLRVLDTQMSS
ncbi:MAG: TIR domain-containing protein [Anaerolineales bacterium]|nr:TIR domain-containing protein [Anaerolineales bacterium]